MNPLRPGPPPSEVPGLFRSTPAMFRDFLARRYRQWPTGTLWGGFLGFLYLVNPLDLIPEALPGIGVVDDALMVGIFFALLSRDVKRYLSWKQQNETPKKNQP